MERSADSAPTISRQRRVRGKGRRDDFGGTCFYTLRSVRACNSATHCALPNGDAHNELVEEHDKTWREFEAMAKRSVRDRIHYGFIKTYKPVLDDEPYRSFETMEEYRQWCEANLPGWLGFGRV